MADDTEETKTGGEEKPAGLMSKLVPAVGIFVLVLAAEVVSPPITTAIYGPPGGGQMASGEEGEEGEGAVEEEAVEDLPPALYQPLEPPMVINFLQDDGSTSFLQMTLQVMSRDQATIDAVKTHLPAIRNNFLFLIGNRAYGDLASVAGKEQLRAELLEEIQAIMKKNIGTQRIEDVYFTSFVMQ